MTPTLLLSPKLEPRLRSQRLRVGFVLAGVTMAAIMLATTISIWAGARELSQTVTAGQAALFQSTLIRALELDTNPNPLLGPPPLPSARELERASEGLDELGLVHVGIYGPGQLVAGFGDSSAALDPRFIHELIRARVLERSVDGRTTTWTAFPLPRLGVIDPLADGQSPPEGAQLPPDGSQPLSDGARPLPDGVRPPPGAGRPPRGEGPPPAGRLPAGTPPDGALPDGTAPPPGAPRFHMVVEFEPLRAQALRVQANRTLAVGIVGALLMVLASLVFWRLSLRVERNERRMIQQRQLATLGEMSAVLAHELRNPLASLKGHAQLLEERLEGSEVDARTRKKASRVVSEARRIEVLSQDLLAFVRAGELAREDRDPRRVVEAALADLDIARVDLDCARAPSSWSLDPVRMQQVLTNLVDNALQANEDPQARVELRVFAAKRRCVFEVRDHGPGVPPDAREAIFEPFHTTRVRGTGLGLAMARRIVELHGGTIRVDDHPEGGARFVVEIPRA
ncbi:hypothetical protein G6O69_17775 [Pseudenhygromyxa sp. WMMC2535]|uniref:ATP-binding protein n=1 Tax=Pseudenhygromyxa sp. WMMC2535 TaxID=2712867 RepID=UPI00155212EE|nr:ATP-binding protein [Pseudenhygromyxa sp. WMMC2535]NVB39697.1 hypothetical protein [Pseudenhygromyxa sp. WMMC2535]